MEDQLKIFSKTYRTSAVPESKRRWDDLYPRLPSRSFLTFQYILVRSIVAIIISFSLMGGALSVAYAKRGDFLYPAKFLSNKVVQAVIEYVQSQPVASTQKASKQQEETIKKQERAFKPTEAPKSMPTTGGQDNQQRKSSLTPVIGEEKGNNSNGKNNAGNQNQNTKGDVQGSKENNPNQPLEGKNNRNNDNKNRGNSNSENSPKKPK